MYISNSAPCYDKSNTKNFIASNFSDPQEEFSMFPCIFSFPLFSLFIRLSSENPWSPINLAEKPFQIQDSIYQTQRNALILQQLRDTLLPWSIGRAALTIWNFSTHRYSVKLHRQWSFQNPTSTNIHFWAVDKPNGNFITSSMFNLPSFLLKEVERRIADFWHFGAQPQTPYISGGNCRPWQRNWSWTSLHFFSRGSTRPTREPVSQGINFIHFWLLFAKRQVI